MFGGDRAATPVDPAVGHVPVLVEAVLGALDPQPGQTYLDLTVGRGGHALAIAERIGADGTLVIVDLDVENLRFAEERVRAAARCRVIALHGSFSDAPPRLRDLGLAADCVLADLGFASTQIDDPERGLSFAADGPLDMRFDRTGSRTAADLLASLPERELGEMLRHLGEEPRARQIARAVVRRREAGAAPQSTAELVALVEEVLGPRSARSRLHPATRTFMALRIAVNDELNRLAVLLDAIADDAGRLGRELGQASSGGSGEEPAWGSTVDRAGRASSRAGAADRSTDGWLRPNARIGIISFHSLEDRLVKHAFAALERAGRAERLTRKPVIASDGEIAANPRSRSAKLRAVRLGVAEASLSADERWRRRRESRGDEDD